MSGAPGQWSDMRLFDAMFELRATRIYEPRTIAAPDLARILRAGTMAGSSGNKQPWEFVVVTELGRKRALAALMGEAIRELDAERAETTEQMVDGVGRSVTSHAAIDNLDVIPAIVIAFWNPDRGVRMKGEYEALPDGTLTPLKPQPGGRAASIYPACQNMMLAAHALGIGSLFTMMFGLRAAEVKELLEVPPQMFLEAGVLLGYAAERLGRPRRRSLDQVVHHNRWGVHAWPDGGEPTADDGLAAEIGRVAASR